MIKQYSFKKFDIRVFQHMKTGMKCCGDSYFVKENEDFIVCGIADGLGSGEFAREASKAAIDELAEFVGDPLYSIMEKVNQKEQNLRGVVMSLFKIDLKTRRGYFCGVGNINMFINDDETQCAQAFPTRGYISGKPMEFTIHEFDFPANGYFAMHSDGIHIHSKQITQLYRMLGSTDESHLDRCSVRNLNDDATLIVGKMI